MSRTSLVLWVVPCVTYSSRPVSSFRAVKKVRVFVTRTSQVKPLGLEGVSRGVTSMSLTIRGWGACAQQGVSSRTSAKVGFA